MDWNGTVDMSSWNWWNLLHSALVERQSATHVYVYNNTIFAPSPTIPKHDWLLDFELNVKTIIPKYANHTIDWSLEENAFGSKAWSYDSILRELELYEMPSLPRERGDP